MGRRARRYCNADCAAQHWKHHKASCRREVALVAAKAARGQVLRVLLPVLLLVLLLVLLHNCYNEVALLLVLLLVTCEGQQQ